MKRYTLTFVSCTDEAPEKAFVKLPDEIEPLMAFEDLYGSDMNIMYRRGGEIFFTELSFTGGKGYQEALFDYECDIEEEEYSEFYKALLACEPEDRKAFMLDFIMLDRIWE